jgi:hypothetical protein
MAGQFTGKQQRFIDAYLGEANFNATRAAEIAGYKGNGNTLAQVGFGNVRKPNIAKEIKARLQASAMSSDELLMRWGDQARVDVSKYYDDESGSFDLIGFRRDGYGHLIKSIKPSKYGPVVEFIDKIKSQLLIARNSGMLVDKSEVVEINAGSLTDFEQWKSDRAKRQDEAEDTLEQFDE